MLIAKVLRGILFAALLVGITVDASEQFSGSNLATPAGQSAASAASPQADGLRIVDAAGDTLVYVDGATVTGEIEVAHGDTTESLTVWFKTATDSLFQPDEPSEFMILSNISDTSTAKFASYDSTNFSFSVIGVEEGHADFTIGLFQDDTTDYSSPLLEIHVVEEEHAEAEGLRIVDAMGDTLVWVDGLTVTGEIEVEHEETTDLLTVWFVTATDSLFQPDEPSEFWMIGTIADTTVAQFASFDSANFTFTVLGVEEGHADFTIGIFHDDHADYLSPDMEIHVEEEHAEAEGLRIVDAMGDTLVWVDGLTVTGEIEVEHEETTDLLTVWFVTATDSLFQPDEPSEFWMIGTIADTTVAQFASFDSANFTFSVTGIEEGHADFTIGIFHDDHADYLSPDMEIHVEEEHAEAEGLRIVDAMGDTLVWVDGLTVTGEIEVEHEETTDLLTVWFVTATDSLFQPDEPSEFWMIGTIADTTVAQFASFDSANFTFSVTGIEEGHADFTIGIFHDDHADYLSPDMEIHVEEEHAEAEGLRIVDALGDTLVWVDGLTVTGEIEVSHEDTTDLLTVWFLTATDSLFQPDEPMEFPMVGSILDVLTADFASFDSTGYTFSVVGVEEGITSTTIGIFHDDHVDYLSPAIEIHVEEHAEAEGLRIVDAMGDTLVWVDGLTVTGEIEVEHEETTDLLTVWFKSATGSLFQPDDPSEFWMVGTIADTTVAKFASFDSTNYTFSVVGVEEGQADFTIAIFHDNHADYTSPGMETHVEEEHAEAEGLRIVDAMGDTLVWVDGLTVTGEIEVDHEETTDLLTVWFVTATDSLFQPDDPAAYWMIGTIADTTVAQFASFDSANYTFSVLGVEEGHADFTLGIFHDDHADYTSPNMEIHVEEEHAEAEGLRLVHAGDTLVYVNGLTITGSVDVGPGQTLSGIEVWFVSPTDSLFRPGEPDEFWMIGASNDTTTATLSALDSALYTIDVTGVAAGNGDIWLGIFHNDHADYTSPAIPVAVSADCCVGSRGDFNCDGNVGLPDLSRMIDYLLISFAPLCCETAADLNDDGGIGLPDLSLLIDHLFITFTPLIPCN